MNYNIKHISIPTPCTQNWAEMDVVEKGKFCQSCQKTVTDFSGLTNEQVIQALSFSGNTCGRFAIGQLESVNAGLVPSPKISLFSWKKFSLAAAFIGFVPFIKVEAQVKPHVLTTLVLRKPDTLSARQVGVRNEKTTDRLKKDSIDIAAMNPPLEEALAGFVGSVQVVSVKESPNPSTLELIRQIFRFYFQQ